MAGKKAARLTDRCVHKVTAIITGSPDTIVNSLLAARLGDHTTPCPICCVPTPGLIVQGSLTVFINKMPAARVDDFVICGIGITPPLPGGFHMPVTGYSVRPEDNYIEAVFTDDGSLIKEAPKDPPKPLPEHKPLQRFLKNLSLQLNIGMRIAIKAIMAGPNMVESGSSNVFIGG